jgi:sarcosine oxidase subunit delta
MKMMPCPLNGPRNISEFVCGGEVKAMPHPATGTDREWAEYLFIEDNARGVVREWWLHVPSSYWFIAERDTATDAILRTFPADQVFRARVDFGPAKR